MREKKNNIKIYFYIIIHKYKTYNFIKIIFDTVTHT